MDPDEALQNIGPKRRSKLCDSQIIANILIKLMKFYIFLKRKTLQKLLGLQNANNYGGNLFFMQGSVPIGYHNQISIGSS